MHILDKVHCLLSTDLHPRGDQSYSNVVSLVKTKMTDGLKFSNTKMMLSPTTHILTWIFEHFEGRCSFYFLDSLFCTILPNIPKIKKRLNSAQQNKVLLVLEINTQ